MNQVAANQATVNELDVSRRAHPLLRAAAALAAAVLLALAAWVPPAAAHDVPDEMVFWTHVVTEIDELHVPLRVPLAWLVDYGFPLRGPGYLDLDDTAALDAVFAEAAADVAADVALYEDGRRLPHAVEGWRVSLPSDRSFDDHREAFANIAGPPVPTDTNLFWNQGFLDLYLTYPIEDWRSSFAVEIVPEALAERLHLLTTFVARDGTVRSYDIVGTLGRVELEPRTSHLLRRFAVAGFSSLLLRWEHVLFVALLAVALGRRPARPLRPVVTFAVVTALVVLVSGGTAGVDGVFTGLLVATAAAASLVVVAAGNALARDLRHRWLTAAVCAVPHGLLLAEGLGPILQFREPGAALPLLAFAAGALPAVALVFAGAAGAGWLLARHEGVRRHGPVAASLLVGYVGWRDLLERGDVLRGLPLPPLDAGTVLGLARWAAVVALVVAALWFAFELAADRRRRLREHAPAPGGPPPAPGIADLDVPAPSTNGHTPATVPAGGGLEPREDDGGRP